MTMADWVAAHDDQILRLRKISSQVLERTEDAPQESRK